MMGPDAAMAGAALADMARRWANSQSGFGGGGQNMENAPQLPLLIDLIENENQYLLTADVPGLQKSDLKACHCLSLNRAFFCLLVFQPALMTRISITLTLAC